MSSLNVTLEDRSTVAKICLGIYPGYLNNAGEPENWYTIRTKIQDILDQSEAECGTFISFTMTPGHVLYKTQWGCKRGGEAVALLEATRNPRFNSDEQQWRRAVQYAARKLKDCFGQSTVTLTFQDADIVYLQ